MPAVLLGRNFSQLFFTHNVGARGWNHWSVLCISIALGLYTGTIWAPRPFFHVLDVEVEVESARDDADDGHAETDILQVVD